MFLQKLFSFWAREELHRIWPGLPKLLKSVCETNSWSGACGRQQPRSHALDLQGVWTFASISPRDGYWGLYCPDFSLYRFNRFRIFLICLRVAVVVCKCFLIPSIMALDSGP